MALLGIASGDETHSPGAECCGGALFHVEVLSAGYFSWAIFGHYRHVRTRRVHRWHPVCIVLGFNIIVGGMMLYAALQLFRVMQVAPSMGIQSPPLWLALIAGRV
jgi:hypothetical protein